MKGFKIFILVIIVLGVVFLGYGAIISSTPEGKEKAKDRDAISYCWKEYDKKSNTDEQKRFIASACEKMESEYYSKYRTKP